MRAALEFLEVATGTQWEPAATPTILTQTGGLGRVWLFDENCGEPHPTFCHDRSGTHMHMKNLELVLSVSEMLGRKFQRASLVHVTCVGVEAGKHVDEGSAQNLLLVHPWRGERHTPVDTELIDLRLYLKHLFLVKPRRVQLFLQRGLAHFRGAVR